MSETVKLFTNDINANIQPTQCVYDDVFESQWANTQTFDEDTQFALHFADDTAIQLGFEHGFYFGIPDDKRLRSLVRKVRDYSEDHFLKTTPRVDGHLAETIQLASILGENALQIQYKSLWGNND